MRHRYGRATIGCACAVFCGVALLAGPAAAESVFDAPAAFGSPPGSFRGLGAATGFSLAAAFAAAAGQDTVETFDVEIEEPEKGASIYKEIAIVAVVSAAVGFAVYQLIKTDDEPVADDGGGSGKPTPFAAACAARLPVIRLR